MRILIVTSYNNGAVAPFVAEQVDALRHTGVECDYYLVQGKGLRGYLRNRTPLCQKIAVFKPDLIHAHYGLCGLLANLQRDIPVVTTFHGSDLLQWRNRWLSRLAHRLSAHSICVNMTLMRKLGRHPQHCTLLPCGVDTERFKPCDQQTARRQLLLPTEQPLVLFSGTYADPVKNIVLARAALQHLSEVRLIEPRGYSREQMALLFNAVDLLLVTSHSEGSPQVVKEALACNCPVISVDVGDVAERISPIDGCTIVARKPEAIAEAIANTLIHRQRCDGRKTLLAQGLANEDVTRRLLNVYHVANQSTRIHVVDLLRQENPEWSRQWDELLRQASNATVFQSREFVSFCRSLYCWEPFAYGVVQNEELKGVMAGFIQREGGKLRRHFTRRAIVNGGPLTADDICDEATKQLLHYCTETLRRKAIYIETRNLNDYSPLRHLFETQHFLYRPHYNYLLPLTEDPQIRYHRSLRRNLRTAEQYRAEICHNATEEEVRQFFNVLQELYHTRVHTPLLPQNFFIACLHSPLFHYTLIKNNANQVIGGTLIAITHPKTAHLWYAADSRETDKHFYPSAVVHDATLRYCQEQGLTSFDFMGAGRPDDGGYGVRDFKAQFGGTLVENGRFLRILHPLLYRIGCIAIKLKRNNLKVVSNQ